MPRFSTGTAKQLKMEQKFSFTGKIRAADVLLQLVEACGYEAIREALEELKPSPEPTPKRRRS